MGWPQVTRVPAGSTAHAWCLLMLCAAELIGKTCDPNDVLGKIKPGKGAGAGARRAPLRAANYEARMHGGSEFSTISHYHPLLFCQAQHWNAGGHRSVSLVD